MTTTLGFQSCKKWCEIANSLKRINNYIVNINHRIRLANRHAISHWFWNSQTVVYPISHWRDCETGITKGQIHFVNPLSPDVAASFKVRSVISLTFVTIASFLIYRIDYLLFSKVFGTIFTGIYTWKNIKKWFHIRFLTISWIVGIKCRHRM